MILRRRRRVIAVSAVYGEPDMIAVLYKGATRYVYMPATALDSLPLNP